MKLSYLAFIVIFVSSAVYAGEVRNQASRPATEGSSDILVEFDEVHINKSTKPDSSWNFTDINLNLAGEGMKKAGWYYEPVYTKVDTESGSLLKTDTYGQNERLWRLKEIEKMGKPRLWLRCKVPQRQDKTLSLEGYAEVYVPSEKDSVVEIGDYLAKSKAIIENPLLKKNKIDIFYLTKDDLAELNKSETKDSRSPKDAATLGKAIAESFGQLLKGLLGMNDSDLTFVVKSEKDAILNIVLMNEKEEVLETNSRSLSRDEKTGSLRYGLKFKKMMPYKGKIRIFIDNGKNVIKVPFKYQVELP